MGTTLTLLWEDDESILIAHVGDSRAYLLRDGKLTRVTEDHSIVGELLRNKKITPEEAKTHPYRNVITRAIGTDAIVEADVARMEKRRGDVWLVCSDGLFHMLDDREIEDVLLHADREEAAGKLLEMTLDRGAEDNVSILLGYVPEVSEA
jgi:protein phosphatase